MGPSAPIDGAILGKPTVLVAKNLSAMSPEDLRAKIPHYDALIVRSRTKVGRDVFEASGGRLRIVGHTGVGINNIDLAAATK
ncbi:hypothetical protein GUJ93_ZPchr0004g39292 [Zizania palustris]|uniref:D-isomer specific 2-hydroxyacid dehydrogenase catalytic domain-containing protein n=1 Tax=Zizania palustris TaxID=103762 RepID=A0A8J5SZJ8_ZIZPA|nr:hypothetical protein GUJ93_ZPchr0004g39292 [Zizania palustris]